MLDDEAYRLINGMSMLFRAKNLLDVKAGRSVNQTMISRTMKGIEDVWPTFSYYSSRYRCYGRCCGFGLGWFPY